MKLRAKYTLHEGSTGAALYVDHVLLTDHVVEDGVPCPDNSGQTCLDVTVEPVDDPAHVYAVQLVEMPLGQMTEIGLPATAQAGTRWHGLLAPDLLGVMMLAAAVGGVVGFAGVWLFGRARE